MPDTKGRFIVNADSKEIHDRRTREERCNLEGWYDRANFKAVSVKEFTMLLQEGFGTCAYCFVDSEED